MDPPLILISYLRPTLSGSFSPILARKCLCAAVCGPEPCCLTESGPKSSLPRVSVTVGEEIYKARKQVGLWRGAKVEGGGVSGNERTFFVSKQGNDPPTWQVEECVQNIKPLRVVSLDELVWVSLANLRAGDRKQTVFRKTQLTHQKSSGGRYFYRMSKIRPSPRTKS